MNAPWHTVYPKKYAHGFCFAVLCCGYTLTDFPISIRLASLALWQSNDCPSASKATLMNMDKYFMWIHYERLHNHNKAKHNKTVCIFLAIYCANSIWSVRITYRISNYKPFYIKVKIIYSCLNLIFGLAILLIGLASYQFIYYDCCYRCFRLCHVVSSTQIHDCMKTFCFE